MELFRHIGLVNANKSRNGYTHKIRGFLILSLLLVVLIIGNTLSLIFKWVDHLFPESTNNLKRQGVAMFWDLCIYFLRKNNVKIRLSGDELEADSAIILCNHRSLADHILIAILARHAESNARANSETQSHADNLTLPRVNFFSWFFVWRIPQLKILMNMAKCDENWELDPKLSRATFEKLTESKFPEWLVVFPEVNIWSEQDLDIQQQQSKKFFLPTLQCLLYPRFSAFYNVISAMNPKGFYKFSKIYDLTLLYEQDNKQIGVPAHNDSDKQTKSLENIPVNLNNFTPTLLDVFSSEIPITIRVNVKTKSLSRVQQKRSKVEKYLEKTWIEKDKLLVEMSALE